MLTRPVLQSYNRATTPLLNYDSRLKNEKFDTLDQSERSALKEKKQCITKSVTKSVTKTKEDRKVVKTAQKKNKTVLIDRASEALEQLTIAYRGVNVAALEHAKEINFPTKHQLEALKFFVLFINAFRKAEDRWPADYLNYWPNLVHFITRAPSSTDLCLELQKLKKIVTRPHLANI